MTPVRMDGGMARALATAVIALANVALGAASRREWGWPALWDELEEAADAVRRAVERASSPRVSEGEGGEVLQGLWEGFAPRPGRHGPWGVFVDVFGFPGLPEELPEWWGEVHRGLFRLRGLMRAGTPLARAVELLWEDYGRQHEHR